MANLSPTHEETMAELEVVKEELRLNYLDNPQGKMRFLLHLTEPLHARDRVGTYGSQHLAEVV